MNAVTKTFSLLVSPSSSFCSPLVRAAANGGSGVGTVGLWINSKRGLAQFDSSRLQIQPAGPSELRDKPPADKLGFGQIMTDHMLTCRWTSRDGWADPVIAPVRPLQLHPAAKVLHYGQELFEGMKAYRGKDDRVRLFRPMHNMARMNVTARRACLPTFDGGELLECIRRLVVLEQEWVPHSESASLYIRPTMIGTEPTLKVADSQEVLLFVLAGPAGPYYNTGEMKPIHLLADPSFVRAWPGGCGYAKMGSNYAPTLWVQKQAEKYGCQQVLWLFGERDEITEVGAMNIFVVLDHGGGRKELVTPPLDKGIILPGVTRRSVLELAESWGDFDVSERPFCMGELVSAQRDGRLMEVFGSGTAAVVTPVGAIHYQGRVVDIPVPTSGTGISHRLLDALNDIYYCRKGEEHPWAPDVEDWKVDRFQETKDYELAARQLEMS